MAFSASKKRGRYREVTAEGSVLIEPAIIRDKYRKDLHSLIKEMYADYISEIRALLKTSAIKSAFMGDSAGGIIDVMFKRLRHKWADQFAMIGLTIANKYVMEVYKQSFTSVASSLSQIGVLQMNDIDAVELSKKAELDTRYNVALITNMSSESISKIERIVWNSLAAPEANKQGGFGIFNELRDQMSMDYRRAKLIADDQTSKIYSELNTIRMEKAGLSKFKWAHSGGGKVPRECHKDWDGKIFLLKGGPNELYFEDGTKVVPGGNVGKSDIGKPGYPINCKCRQIPILDLG